MNGPMSIQRLQGAGTIEYFSHVLRTGGAVHFDATLLQDGRFSAVVPRKTDSQRVSRFDTGGLLVPEPARVGGRIRIQALPTSIPSVSTIVADRIGQFAEPSIWVHEPMLQEDEISTSGFRCQKIEDRLYLVYEDNLRNSDRIADIIRYSMLSWHFLAFVTDHVHSVRSVTALAEHAQMILVGAYDGESILLWERSADT